MLDKGLRRDTLTVSGRPADRRRERRQPPGQVRRRDYDLLRPSCTTRSDTARSPPTARGLGVSTPTPRVASPGGPPCIPATVADCASASTPSGGEGETCRRHATAVLFLAQDAAVSSQHPHLDPRGPWGHFKRKEFAQHPAVSAVRALERRGRCQPAAGQRHRSVALRTGQRPEGEARRTPGTPLLLDPALAPHRLGPTRVGGVHAAPEAHGPSLDRPPPPRAAGRGSARQPPLPAAAQPGPAEVRRQRPGRAGARRIDRAERLASGAA